MAQSQLGSAVRAFLRLTLYLGFTVAMMPIQAIALMVEGPAVRLVPRWYHRRCCAILDIEVQRRGRQSRIEPTLYVSNHASYLDITVLGSLIAGSFVAKSEVADWPLFGWLAKLQRTVFVERRRSRAADHRDQVVDRLAEGDNLILFAEGTSNDGNRVLPFKSSLFAVAETQNLDKPLTIQPVSVAYTKLDGLPLGRFLRPFFAWYGDMDLAPHIWQLVGLGRLTAVVEFHQPVTVAELGTRKALSDHCYRAVLAGVAGALSGRRPLRETSAAAAVAA